MVWSCSEAPAGQTWCSSGSTAGDGTGTPSVTFWTGVQRWRAHLTAKCGSALGTIYDTLSRRSDVTPGGTLSLPGLPLRSVPPGWEAVFDSRELALQGRVQVLIPDGDRPAVAEADLSRAGHLSDGSG